MTNQPKTILVDFDGTLAKGGLARFGDPTLVGEPIPLMLARVKRWIAEGHIVKVFTARVSQHSDPSYAPRSHEAITKWCRQWVGHPLEVTCIKDHTVTELWDDWAIGVVRDTGLRADRME